MNISGNTSLAPFCSVTILVNCVFFSCLFIFHKQLFFCINSLISTRPNARCSNVILLSHSFHLKKLKLLLPPPHVVRGRVVNFSRVCTFVHRDGRSPLSHTASYDATERVYPSPTPPTLAPVQQEGSARKDQTGRRTDQCLKFPIWSC